MPVRGSEVACDPFPPHRRCYLGYAKVHFFLFFLGECGGAGAFSCDFGMGGRCACAVCRHCVGSVGRVGVNFAKDIGDLAVLVLVETVSRSRTTLLFVAMEARDSK